MRRLRQLARAGGCGETSALSQLVGSPFCLRAVLAFHALDSNKEFGHHPAAAALYGNCGLTGRINSGIVFSIQHFPAPNQPENLHPPTMPKKKNSKRRGVKAKASKPERAPVREKTPGNYGSEAAAARRASKKRELPQPAPDVFPVVGIGASAGGLEASTQLLQALPSDIGMAFVLIQHLDPKHESMLSEILSRSSAMPVHEVKQDTHVEPNHVYVIPRGFDLAISNRVLHTTPRKVSREAPMTIDHFFRSLAEDLGNQAIGVILSGTGSDGSMGVKAVKAEGGITFAQDEKSAKYDGMPHSAIASGCVDFVLAPEDIARELSLIRDHPYVAPKPVPPEEIIPVSDDALVQILHLIHTATGVDLLQYKPNTIKRRILRRMLLHKSDSLERYLERLRTDTAEVHSLFEDILINVTQFFRDQDIFTTLKENIFPKIVPPENSNGAIRIWVPGCSTGEEVYSIAIALVEFTEEHSLNPPIQFFATDISEVALERARVGVYEENIAADVSAERLKRFFIKSDRGYQISKRIRDLCIFARQNLTKDPPFSKLDLISCRNVLIYLGPSLQKRVLPIFHYALKNTGYLLLGSSETISTYADLFTLVDKKHKIFSKKPVPVRAAIDFSYGAPRGEPAPATQERDSEKITPWTALDLQREADRIVISRFGPAGVVVNEDLDVMQFRGQIGAYLEPSPGPANYNVLKMAREGLLPELRSALQRARTGGVTVRKENLRVRRNGEFHEFDLEVIPIRRPPYPGTFFMVLFHPAGVAAGKKPAGRKAPPVETEAEEVKSLRQELSVTRETLQAIIEEQEASNEELRSANEEVQSSNEELQSTNEELETAKEELQSSNEELNTVNEELESRNDQLAQANDDLRNLLSNVNLPIVMVSEDQRIRRTTPQAEKVMGVIPSDTGRPIGNIRTNLTVPNLEQTLAEVTETLRTYEAEVQDIAGRWYLLRIRPYRTEENKIEGAVLMLVDIDDIKRTAEEIREARDFNSSVIDTVRSPLFVLDNELRIKFSNPAFYQMFQLSRPEVHGHLIYEIGNGQWNFPAFHDLLDRLLPEKARLDDIEIDHEFPNIGRRVMLFNARRLEAAERQSEMVLISLEDITERKRSEETLLQSKELLEQKVQERTAELQSEIAARQKAQSALEQSEAALQKSHDELRGLTASLINAHEEERLEISRELHDALNQRVAMLEINVETLERNPPADTNQTSEQLRSLREGIHEISNEVRRMAYQLHPSILDDLGLPAALRSYVEDLTKRDGIAIKLSVRDVPASLPPPVALTLYRVAQEALMNVLKHANSPNATVTLARQNSAIQLTIRDKGTGFDRASVKGKGRLGLINMEERVRLVKGKIEIHSKPGEGTRIEASIPLPASEEKGK
ncbi:MAG TPA: chemotaxis protein CheB [Bryobacteraceae bacterium]|nr:chemotaxis protein CheB [Bryobacteraceae bacterium]